MHYQLDQLLSHSMNAICIWYWYCKKENQWIKAKVHCRAAQQRPDVTKPNQVVTGTKLRRHSFFASKMWQQHLPCGNTVNDHVCRVSQLVDPASFSVFICGCLIHRNSRSNFQGDKNLKVLEGLIHLQHIWRCLKSFWKDQGTQINQTQNATENDN